jgi:hypothetical protein
MADEIFAPGFKESPWWWEAAEPAPAAVPPLPDRAEVADRRRRLLRHELRARAGAPRQARGGESRPSGSASAPARATAAWSRGGLKLARDANLAGEHGAERAARDRRRGGAPRCPSSRS